jgi:hypothetical protein
MASKGLSGATPVLEGYGKVHESLTSRVRHLLSVHKNFLDTFCLLSPVSCIVALATQTLARRKLQSGSIRKERSISKKCTAR